MTYSDMKFGIEMEFTFVTRRRAAKSLADVFGTRDEYIGGSYDTHAAADAAGRVWKIQRDSSIMAQEMRSGNPVRASAHYQCELVTPVLTFADMPLLQKVIRQLRADGAKSNDSCGFHVHLSAPEEFDTRSLINLINMVHSKQTLMYEALGVIPRRMQYAEYLPDRLCEEIKRARPKTNEKLARVWYSALGGCGGTGHYDPSRYHCLNLHNLFSGRQPTVEFRCANGSLRDARVVRATIELYALMVAYAFNAKSCSSKAAEPTGSHKYAFRVFMLKIGCIGEELATCRKYMLQNLPGDIAWRDR